MKIHDQAMWMRVRISHAVILTPILYLDTCFEVTTMSEREIERKGHGTIPTKGHLDPLLLGGGITQDEIAHQLGSPTNFGGRSEARNISLIRGKKLGKTARDRPSR